MSCVVLEILNLDTNNCSGSRSVIIIFRILDWKQVIGEGGVHGVRQQDKLERHLLLQLNRDSIGLLEEDCNQSEISIVMYQPIRY